MVHNEIVLSMESIIQPIFSHSFAIFASQDEFSKIQDERDLELDILRDDDAVYDDYDPNTTDPGNTLFIIAVCVCLASILSLPFAVVCGRNRAKANTAREQQESSNPPEESQDEMSHGRNNEPARPWYVKFVHSIVDSLVMWRHAHNETRVDNGIFHETRASKANLRADNDIPQNINVENGGIGVDINRDELGNENIGVSIESFEIEKVNGQEITKKQSEANQMKLMMHSGLMKTIEISKYDNESKRIMKLAVPFMMNNIVKTVGELALLAIISQNLGTNPMIAFAMVEVIVGVSSSFMMGWIETINSLGAMAHGAENYELVGQHVQSAILVFVACQIPTALVWGFSMYSIILLFGFEEESAQIASQYVWVFCANEIMDGILQALIDFLGLIDSEQLGMVFSCSRDLSQLVLCSIVIYTNENVTLTIVGLILLANTCLFVFLTFFISSWKQLTRPYEYGMIGELSLRNKDVMKSLIETGLPLAVGGLLAYAEWEILTIFAAVLGPAEAATWAILGFVWDVFESTTEAIGDAAEVRCAYQLGKGRPEMAKMSAYKSMLLSLVVAVIITTVFLSLSEYLPAWLTTDQTIQGMLIQLFPLMGLGNLTMTVGMVCWALIGAQMRYRLATSINLATSLLISVPLGAVMTIVLRIDLRGLTFSIIMGYVVCAWIMVIVILVSDWEALSDDIRERVANGDLDIESCSTEGSGLYGAYDWDELPEEARNAAELLGYNKSLWDNDKEPELAEKDWVELTTEQQEAATLLGYDKAKWDGDGNKPEIYNQVLSHDEEDESDKGYFDNIETRETALTSQLELSPTSYATSDANAEPSTQLSPASTAAPISYDHLNWANLPKEVQEAAALLGFNEELWDEDEEPDECDRYWKNLSDQERKAAEVLGYNEVRWNED